LFIHGCARTRAAASIFNHLERPNLTSQIIYARDNRVAISLRARARNGHRIEASTTIDLEKVNFHD